MRKQNLLLLFGAALLSAALYLLFSRQTHTLGFPLDDAWIHQTYARNLAERGEWSFIPGMVSAGSTAPLWSGLLAAGYWLGLAPLAWTYALGLLSLLGLGLVGFYAAGRFGGLRRRERLLTALFLLFEWHLVWAAVSGMETLLYALVITLVLVLVSRGDPSWWLAGLLIGAGAWLRPESLTLIGPAAWAIYFSKGDLRVRTVRFLQLAAGAALVFIPYLLFNRAVSGQFWPNTFYAKQAEYLALQQIPFGVRLGQQLFLPLVGAGSLLLPGVILFFWRAFRQKQFAWIGGGIWLLGYAGLFALRLPVTYQHGRYLMPAMPVFFIWGLLGFFLNLKGSSKNRLRWVAGRVWAISLAAVAVVFWFQGGAAYGRDVAIIETEMVAAARWLQENTPEESLIAAHDIGAIGFYSGRDIIDLAGLVSPEVIPMIRDEARLSDHLVETGADFLVTLEGWYPRLEQLGHPVFRTEALFSPASGGSNMVVYKLGDG